MGRITAFFGKIWTFISVPGNLAVLTALGVGLGFWTNRLAPVPVLAPAAIAAPAPVPGQNASASGGGIAVIASGNAKVVIGAQQPAAQGAASASRASAK